MHDENDNFWPEIPELEETNATQHQAAAPVDPDQPEGHRSGYVSLVGRPNVGKSTLLNQLIGKKLSIVTSKPQTTRHRILGIQSGSDHQVIFVDTPGIIKPRYGLQKSMIRTVKRAIRDADLLLFMVDATLEKPDDLSLSFLADHPAILAINKIDLVDQAQALPLVDAYRQHREFDEIVPISAKTGYQVDLLQNLIRERLPEGPKYYPQEMLSEHPERFFVAEIIREKIFERFYQEVPYTTQVNIVEYEEREDSKDFISAEIVTEEPSQKKILIGERGNATKGIGISARKEIEEFLQRDVYLQLHVKVKNDWRNRENLLQSYGYPT